MADEEVEGQAAEEPAGSKKNLIVLAGSAVAALAAGAGITWFLVKPDADRLAELEAQAATVAEEGGAPAAEAAPAPAEGGEPAEGAAAVQTDFAERVLPLEPFIVNVSGHDYARYLKVKIELEADSTTSRGELEQRLPQIRDGVIVLLSSKRLADITDFEGKALLKEDILERVNGMLEQGAVRQVMFTEFVVQ